MKKLFTSILMLSVALCSWGVSVKSFSGGVLTLESNGVSFSNFVGSQDDLSNSTWKGQVNRLVLIGDDFTNADFNGGKMGEFIANCAGSGDGSVKTLYLDLTNASGLVSQVTYTSTDKNPVANPQYVYSTEKERKDLIKKESYYLPDGNPVPSYAIDQNMLKTDGNGNWWLEGYQGQSHVDVTAITEYGYYSEYWNYPDNPNPNSWVAVNNPQTDDNGQTYYAEIAKDGTPFAFGIVDQNNSVQQNYCGQYINGITFPKGDNFTAIPDKLCCTALCKNLETVVWGDQLEWIGADAFRGGVKGYDGDDSHYSPASELKNIGTMNAQGTVTFPTIQLPNEGGTLTDVNQGVVKFPSTLKVIGMDAFYECTDFRYVNLDLDELVKVDAAAFNMRLDDQNHLDSVQMPSKTNTSLKFWGNQVFSSSHVKTLDFRYCEGIKHFAYDGTSSMGEMDHNPITGGVGTNTFYWHPYLTKLVLPPNLEYLAGGTSTASIVHECKNLETVEFTGRGVYGDNCNLTNGLIIPDYAFAFSTNESDPNGACNITVTNQNGGSSTLRKLKNVILSDRISQINEYAFNKTYIETIHIPASVSRIKQHAFNECRNLKVVVFDDVQTPNTCSAQTVVEGGSGSGAFYNCAGITDVYVNNLTEELICDNYAFDYGVTWGHANPGAPFATLHFPKDFIDHYVNLKHPLTDQIASDPAKFHLWLHKHIQLAGVPHKNGWYEFINSGPVSTTIEEEPVYNQGIVLRTFSDYFYSYLVPDGLRAYVVNGIEKNGDNYEVSLQRILVIPAKTGVILYGHPNSKNLNGEPILSMTPIEFAEQGDKLDDGSTAGYDHGQPLCRANWDPNNANQIKNFLEPTSTPTAADVVRIKARIAKLQAQYEQETDETKKAQLLDDLNDETTLLEEITTLIPQHDKDWKNGGKYLKPFENKVNDDPMVVNTSTGNDDVGFRNFTLGRYNGTLHLHNKNKLEDDDTQDYAAFFRVDPGFFSTGKAYLRLSATEYDQPTGAEILVKEDNGAVPYYYEYDKNSDKGATINYRSDDYRTEAKNPKHWWDDQWGFDWGITNKYFTYTAGGEQRTVSRMNWGVRPTTLPSNPQLGALQYLGEVGGDVDGIMKVVIPATAVDDYYTLQGVKVKNPGKGVYIRDGKKVIIK